MFRNNGSIFVQFPYFRECEGILTEATFVPSGLSGETVIRLRDQGRATSHLVKYHHPPDGNVHFSQDGRIRSDVRRQSFPLTESGVLWELHAFHLEGFENLSPRRVRRARAYLQNIFRPSLPRAIKVFGEWRHRGEVAALLEGPSRGPFCHVRSGIGGSALPTFLLGPPVGSRFDDHLLLLRMFGIDEAGVDRSSMIFLGGWDSPEDVGTQPGTSCLCFMYPSGDDHSGLVAEIGTVDL